MAESGMDLEKPSPDQKSVGILDDSPSGFFCIAVDTEMSRLQKQKHKQLCITLILKHIQYICIHCSISVLKYQRFY